MNCSFVHERGSKTRKLAAAGLLAAAAILLSGVHFPLGPTKCFPFQHAINVLAGAILGPWWASGAAFATSLVRNMTGMGTLFAFPGSIPGALPAGFAYRIFRRPWAGLAEPVGTGFIGAPVSAWILGPAMGTAPGLAALQAGFLLSSIPGALIGIAVLHFLKKSLLHTILSEMK